MKLPISILTVPPGRRERPYTDQFDDNDRIVYHYRGEVGPSEQPDNLSLREVAIRRLPLIYFLGIQEGLYFPVWPAFIVGDDPITRVFRVQVDVDVDTPTMVADLQTAESGRRQYLTVITLRRLHQASFRQRVIRAYQESCAICRLRHAELLDAAHILPDGHPNGRPEVSNGLALCKLHHAAFDRGVIGIRPDLVVEVQKSVLDEVDGPMLVHGIQDFHGRPLAIVPRHPSQQPKPEFLQERYARFIA